MDRGTSTRRAPPTGRNSFIMRILHIVKTSGGAAWAALEAAELARLGVEVHVAVPAAEGSSMRLWEEAAAKIHIAPVDFPRAGPWRLPSVCSRARAIVASVNPDVIHTHHVGPTLVMRHALGRSHSIPRVFQVPGPLHLEHWLYRTWDLACAGANDFWIASSRCIKNHYLQAGVDSGKLFLRARRSSFAAWKVPKSICSASLWTEARNAKSHSARQIDLSHDAIIAADENRVITGWNTGAQEMYGWTEAEALGNVSDHFFRTSAAISTGTINEILSRAGRWDGELEHSRRDGTRLTVDSRQVLLRDPAGNPAGILEINRDITERKQAREQLLEAHRQTTAILEGISDGFNVFDREWRYKYVNAAAARMVHKPREELLRKNV